MRDLSSAEFRSLCSRFASGVTVVTAFAGPPESRPVGMTVSSFTSVSLDPPLILVCVRKQSQLARYCRDATHFGVNVLSDTQESLSRRFSCSATEDRFAGVPWHCGLHSVPVLDDTIAHLICATENTVSQGDHAVIFGRVLHGRHESDRFPLVYWRSAYHALEGKPDGTPPLWSMPESVNLPTGQRS